jgi:hypothetical protein
VTRSQESANSIQALVAIDTGKDLGESLEGPWQTGLDHKSPWKISVYPTIQPWPGVVLHSDNRVGRVPQSALLLHQDYGKLLDVETMRHDPFYALHELFAFCASSELQFLYTPGDTHTVLLIIRRAQSPNAPLARRQRARKRDRIKWNKAQDTCWHYFFFTIRYSITGFNILSTVTVH